VGKKINRRSYSGFISDNFGVSISPGKYLAEFDLTRQMMGSRVTLMLALVKLLWFS
jgi:hypothetical protein